MPYDIAGALQNPNIIGNALAAGQAGRLAGLQDQAVQKQNALAQLAGQAYAAPAPQQNALVSQMVGIDPQAGMAMGSVLAGRAQAQEVDHTKRLGGAARYMAQALQSKNPAQIEGAWQAVRPYLAQISGKEPPQQWDPAMEPALYQAIAATGGMPDVKGVVVAPGSVLANPTTGERMLANPAALQYHDVPMGEGKAAGAFDPSTGTVRPAVGGVGQGGPQIDPMQPFIDQANAAIQMGAPQAQVEAWLQQQAQKIGAQPQMPGQGGNQLQTTQAVAPAQFGVGTPKPTAADNTFTQLSPAEVAQLGLPAGTVAQRGSNGKIDVVTKPSTTDARLSMQARTAKGALSGSMQQLDRLKQAAMDLKNDPGLAGVTGYRGHIPDLPGSDAARARAQLDTLKSQIGFGVLQQMREMSKTGGALGSVSDRENTMLQNNLAALSTNQSAEDFAKSLDKIMSYVDDAKARMQGAYADTYGDVTDGGQAAPSTGSAAAGSVDDLLSKYGVH